MNSYGPHPVLVRAVQAMLYVLCCPQMKDVKMQRQFKGEPK